MKIKTIIQLFLTAVFLLACTPDIEDDYVRIDFSNRTQFCFYNFDSLDAILVKVKYYAHPSRNEVLLEDSSYTENALFFRPDESSNWIYRHTFDPDSDIFAAKRENNDFFFIQKVNSDTTSFYYMIDMLTGALDTLTSIDYISSLAISEPDSLDSLFINNLNKYKPYRQWQDELINLYR